MKKFTLFLALIFFCTLCFSQRGYLGKKTWLRYELASSPSLSNPTLRNDLGVNKIHHLSLEYATGNSTQLGLGISYNRTRVLFDKSVSISVDDQNYDSPEASTDNNYAKYSPNFKGVMSTSGYHLYINLFSQNAISYIGKYHQFRATVYQYRIDVNPSDLEIGLDDISSSYLSQNEIKSIYPNRVTNNYHYSAFSLSYGAYYQRILFSMIPVNFGLQLGWLYGGFLSSDKWNDGNISDELIGIPFQLEIDDYVKVGSRSRLSSQGILNFKLGIGFLAL